MTDLSDTTETFSAPGPPPSAAAAPPPFYSAPPKRTFTVGVGGIAVVVIVAIVLGLVGGVASHALFPQKQGPEGKQGIAGKTGAAGAIGPVGPAANVDLSKLGVCVNVAYFTDNAGFGTSYTWVSNVDIFTPTVTNGTQSCPTGTFTPVAASAAPAPTQ